METAVRSKSLYLRQYELRYNDVYFLQNFVESASYCRLLELAFPMLCLLHSTNRPAATAYMRCVSLFVLKILLQSSASHFCFYFVGTSIYIVQQKLLTKSNFSSNFILFRLIERLCDEFIAESANKSSLEKGEMLDSVRYVFFREHYKLVAKSKKKIWCIF